MTENLASIDKKEDYHCNSLSPPAIAPNIVPCRRRRIALAEYTMPRMRTEKDMEA